MPTRARYRRSARGTRRVRRRWVGSSRSVDWSHRPRCLYRLKSWPVWTNRAGSCPWRRGSRTSHSLLRPPRWCRRTWRRKRRARRG